VRGRIITHSAKPASAGAEITILIIGVYVCAYVCAYVPRFQHKEERSVWPALIDAEIRSTPDFNILDSPRAAVQLAFQGASNRSKVLL